MSDFIILAEFSEILGPVVIDVIPPGYGYNFDQNAFVLRVMAVDFQKKGGREDLPALNSQDLEVVIQDKQQNVQAYLHHLSVLDFFARGYSRPCCICYVSADKDKLVQLFQQLHLEFQEIAQMLKQSARVQFIQDVQNVLNELYEFQNLLRIKNDKGHALPQDFYLPKRLIAFEADLTKENVDRIIDDMKEIQRRVQSGAYPFNGQQVRRISINNLSDDDLLEDESFLGPCSVKDFGDSPSNDMHSISIHENQDSIFHSPSKVSKHTIKYTYRPESKDNRSIKILCASNYDFVVKKITGLHNRFKGCALDWLLSGMEEEEDTTHASALSFGGGVTINFNLNPRPTPELSTDTKGSNNLDTSEVLPFSFKSPNLKEWEKETLDIKNEFSPYSSPRQSRSESTSSLPSLFLHSNQQTLSLDIEYIISKSDSALLLSFLLLHRFRSFSKHLISSILSGRTLIVYAQPNNQTICESIIHSLSFFIPGYLYQKHIIPWRNSPFKFSNIGLTKLVGLSRSICIPNNIERFVSILFYEENILHAPYHEFDDAHDSFLNGFGLDKPFNPANSTIFLQQIRLQLLDIGMKAFLLYHLRYSQKKPKEDDNEQGLDSPEFREALLSNASEYVSFSQGSKSNLEIFSSKHDMFLIQSFKSNSRIANVLKSIRVFKTDAQILEYLCKLVIYQETLAVQRIKYGDDSDWPTPPIIFYGPSDVIHFSGDE